MLASCLRHFPLAAERLPSPTQVGVLKIRVVIVAALHHRYHFSPGSTICSMVTVRPSVAHLCSRIAGVILVPQEQYSHSEDVTLEHLEVNTPSVEYLCLRLRSCYKQILVSDYPNIKKACLDIYPTPRDVAWVPKVLRALCKTKLLWLQLSTIECLISAPVLDLPDFCNLIQLKINFHSFQSSFLIDLIHNCPKLQALKIYISDVWLIPSLQLFVYLQFVCIL